MTREPCSNCNGSGLSTYYDGPDSHVGHCTHCDGTGYEPDSGRPTLDQITRVIESAILGRTATTGAKLAAKAVMELFR